MSPVLLLPRRITIVLVLTLVFLGRSPVCGWAASQLTLTWIDNATNEIGFKIDRKVIDPKVGDTGIFTFYVDVNANVTTYTDTKVTPGFTYCYRVKAYNGNSESPYSNDSCATLPTPPPTPPPPPPAPSNVSLSISSIIGQGTVSGGSSGINCPSTCSKAVSIGAQISLTPTSSSGWQFSSWGGDCSGQTGMCKLTMDQAKKVTATFTQTPGGGSATPVTIGTFRDGYWSYDKNGNIHWDGCATDTCLTYGTTGDQPVIGVWVAGGKKQIGVFRQGAWYLDTNGDGRYNACGNGDTCLFWGITNDRAVAADWNGDGKTDIGVFRNGRWFLDANGNRLFDGCGKGGDVCAYFGAPGDQPIAGDWNGDGKADIGIFRNGIWQLDMNNNRAFDGCVVDKCISWGVAGDLPMVGDLSGNGQTTVGLFHKGAWQIDTNRNYRFEGCATDTCFGFGGSADIPVPR